MSQESAEPLGAKTKDANRGGSEGKADPLTTVCFLPTRVNKESAERARTQGRCSGIHSAFGRLDAGSHASFTWSTPAPP